MSGTPNFVDGRVGAAPALSDFFIGVISLVARTWEQHRGPQTANLEDAITNMLAFMLELQRHEPELVEWVRYQLLAEATPEAAREQALEYGNHLAAIRQRHQATVH